MTRGRLFGKGLWKGFSWGGKIGFFPIYLLCGSGNCRSGSGSGELYLALGIVCLALIAWGILSTVVGTLIGLGVGITWAITRKPTGTTSPIETTQQLAALDQNQKTASKFTEILIKRYESRRTLKSGTSRELVKQLKTGGYNSAKIREYLTKDSNDGKRLYRLIHEVLGESKKSWHDGRAKTNARVLRLGKNDPSSPFSTLPAELLVKIATFARPEGMDANVAQNVAQDIIRPVEVMTPGR